MSNVLSSKLVQLKYRHSCCLSVGCVPTQTQRYSRTMCRQTYWIRLISAFSVFCIHVIMPFVLGGWYSSVALRLTRMPNGAEAEQWA